MSSLRVLGNKEVLQMLISLSKSEVLDIQRAIGKSLFDFSNGKEREFQPDAGVVRRPNGQKTLFRSFTSPTAVGAKIIVVPAPTPNPHGSDAQSPNPFTAPSSLAPALNGILTLCDIQGRPTGVINAAEVTAYRTSMSAIIPYMWRRDTEKIVVFGSGQQALWHIRLALALRGSEIKNITVVNRSKDRAESMLKQVEEDNQRHWKSQYISNYLGPSLPDYNSQLENVVSGADVIFCTVPSREPLFPSHYLTKASATGRHPFISAIGSWQPDMIELDPNLLKHVVESQHGYNPNSNTNGLIIVDNRDEAHHTGEISQSGLKAEQTAELGEVIKWREASSSEAQHEGQIQNERLTTWLHTGFVIYKSVGVGVTDLASGDAILAIAEKRGLGILIPDF